MALKGDLASVDLAQVFQMLAMNQKVGLLMIQAPRAWRALFFDQRGVTLYYNEHTLLDRVLSSMVITGALAEDAVRDARDHAARAQGTVVDSLLAGGFLSEDQLIKTFRASMEEEVYDLFFWRDARFEFFEGAASFEGYEGVVNDQFFFSTDGLIMEAARRIDEWGYIRERVAGPLEVFRATGSVAFDLGDDVIAVLDLVDGKRNVARLIEITGLPGFHVYKTLAVLLDAGHVEPMPARQLLHSAQECMSEGRLQDAVNLYEKAISSGEGLPTAHSLVAQAYQAMQEFELAAYHLNCEAEHHATAGNVKQAVSLLVHATKTLPTHLAARARLVSLTVGRNDLRTADFDPVTEGKNLVELFLEMGEVDRVRTLLEDLLRTNANDLELKKSLVNVYTKAGDTRRVIEIYESIAADLVRQHDPIEAVKFLQKILMLDRSRKDISERIKSLYEIDERVRSRRRSLVALGVALLLMIALGGLWYLYEQHARQHYERIDVAEHIAAKNYVAAATVYKGFIDSYPLTIVGKDAEAELVKIQGLQAAYEAEIAQKNLEKQGELARRRTQYKLEFERYRSESTAQNLDGALAAIEGVRKAVAECGDGVDLAWAEQVKLEKSYVELRDYLANAAALERAAREKTRDGNWQLARKDLLELVRSYNLARAARGVKLPVLIESRPPGAELLQGGRPVLIEQDGRSEAVRTPVLWQATPTASEEFELRLPGFEPAPLRIEPQATDTVTVALTPSPDRRFRFETMAVGGPSLGAGFVGVGLRSGKIALSDTQGSQRLPLILNLPGLSELVGNVAFSTSRVVFRTNEGHLACHNLSDGERMWLAELPAAKAAEHDPAVQDGRVFFGDAAGSVVCLSLETGRRLWAQPLDGPVAGAPRMVNRMLRVATKVGTLYRLDASDGRIDQLVRFENGISTGVEVIAGGVVVGTGDGRLRAVADDGGKSKWVLPLGRAPRIDEVALGDGDILFVMGGDDLLLRVKDGTIEQRQQILGERRAGPVLAGNRVFLLVRRRTTTTPSQTEEVLMALDAASLQPLWEYRDEKGFLGAPASDGAAVFVTNSAGEVLRFR
jgi:outer membrane protein assembly factor BamB/tetratricopeptide (TPR) repeat protein